MDPGLPDDVRVRARAVLEELGITTDTRLAEELLAEAIGLVSDRPHRLDLKIATAALAEMRDAFGVFDKYRDVPKVTIFGSARTKAHDPLYEQAIRGTVARFEATGAPVTHLQHELFLYGGPESVPALIPALGGFSLLANTIY